VAGRSRSALAFVVVAALAGAAGAAAGTWPKHEPNAKDQALAKKSILHITDFTPGSGWAKAPDTSSGSVSANDPSCSGPQFSDVGRVLTGTASSSFQAQGLQVWSEADVMKTLAMANKDAVGMASAAFTTCMSAILRKSMPKTARFVSVKELSFPRVGDWSKAYRALFDISAKGVTIRFQFDIVMVRSDRVEISLMQMAPFVISSQAKDGEVRLVQRLAGSSTSLAA